MMLKKVNNFLETARALVIIIILDSIWLGVLAKSFYKQELSSILRSEFLLIPGIIVWLLMAFGIVYFVLDKVKDVKSAILNGSLFGLVLYGVYDLANYAILANWNLDVVIIDIIWGMVLCSVVCVLSYKMRK